MRLDVVGLSLRVSGVITGNGSVGFDDKHSGMAEKCPVVGDGLSYVIRREAARASTMKRQENSSDTIHDCCPSFAINSG
jgi:hypothetical protein